MEYRGKHYTIAQGIGSESWTWTVHLNPKTIKSGEAKTRQAAMTNVVWLVDRTLAPKKEPTISPSSEAPTPDGGKARPDGLVAEPYEQGRRRGFT